MNLASLDDLFTYAEAQPLDEAEEATLIVMAQAGDETATLSLMYAYGPALRSAVSRFSVGVRGGRSPRETYYVGGSDLEIDDLRSTAVATFLEVVKTHDPEKSPRLAGRLPKILARSLADEFSAAASFAVPERTLSRFYGILRHAEGDPEVGRAMAPDYGMSPETFTQVLLAVRATSLDGLEATREDGSTYDSAPSAQPIYAPSPVVDVEDKILVEHAFLSVTDEEARICELAYGFTDYDPVPDAEIAHRLDLTRPTVQRKRGQALGKMRRSLGVDL